MKNTPLVLLIIGLVLTLNAKSQVDTLYFFDFADALPNGWIVTDSTNNGFNWVHTYTGLSAVYNSQSASTLNSTSSSNGWLMMHAAFYNTDTVSGLSEVEPLVNMNSLVTSSPFDFSSEPQIFLKLEHYFRTLSNPLDGSLELGVSTDNINWEIYDLHTGFDAPLNTQEGIETISIDISSIAAFEPTVWIRFHFRNLAWHFWCIDDLTLTKEDVLTQVEKHLGGTGVFQVAPNPTTDYITIIGTTNHHFELFSLEGKLLESGRVSGEKVDVRPYQKGVYLVRIVETGQLLKVVKE